MHAVKCTSSPYSNFVPSSTFSPKVIFFFSSPFLLGGNAFYWVAHKNVPIFSDNNFYKNKETFKIFSPQLLEVSRILLVETTLKSTMFYYTFSLINTIFVPCTTLLYDSTAATWTLKLSTTLLNISCGIHLISFLMMSSLACTLFS